MCGPLVGAFAMRRRTERREISTPLVLFQTGRLTTYVLLGAMVGGLGQTVANGIRDWQGLLSVTLGLFMALLGLSFLGLLPIQRWISALAPTQFVTIWIRKLMSSDHAAAPFGLGLANGLLPCGPVYAMALLAAVSGDPLKGAGIMLIFGLGTLPALLGLGFSTSVLSLSLRSNLYRVAALLVVLVGVQLAMRGLAVGGQISHAAVGGVMLW
jgi:sulfite exporter TauE/SafE